MLDESLNTRGSNNVAAYSGCETDFWEDVVLAIRTEYLSASQDYPWIIGFSGGKDSQLLHKLYLRLCCKCRLHNVVGMCTLCLMTR